MLTKPQTIMTTKNNIPDKSEILTRLEKAYATQYPFTHTTLRESGDRRYDLSRQVVEIVPVNDKIMLVIDQPKNFKDSFDYVSCRMISGRAVGTATLMREWYSVKILRLDTMTIETEGWKGSRLPKDFDKAMVKFFKFKAYIEKTELPLLPSIQI